MLSRGARKKVAIFGAGAFGGWAALQLARAGADVTLVDAWGPGHSRSSSGGESRVIRAIYGPDEVYVRMVRESFGLWDDLIEESGEALYVETGALWLLHGSQKYVDDSLPLLHKNGFDVEDLPPDEAASRYPMIDFDGVERAILEKSAGALSARRGCQVVAERVAQLGGKLVRASALPPTSGGSRLESVSTGERSSLTADAFVFCCGPWLGRLFPELLGEAIRPSRQEVYYFGVPAGSDAFSSARCPVWIDFDARVYYGLPDVHGRGFKIADDTRGDATDPTSQERSPTREGVAAARSFLSRRFPALAQAPLVEARVCQYENSPDGDLIVDRHPAYENVWIAGGGSGHGFKLAPAVGSRVADLVLDRGSVERKFALDRLGRTGRAGTQFDASDR